MRKPLNRFAAAMWIVAAVYFGAKLWGLVYVDHSLADLATAQNTSLGRSLIMGLSSTIAAARTTDTLVSAAFGAAQLLGLGAVIEILDAIRWNGKDSN